MMIKKIQTHILLQQKSDKGPSIFQAGKRSLSKGGKGKSSGMNLKHGDVMPGLKEF